MKYQAFKIYFVNSEHIRYKLNPQLKQILRTMQQKAIRINRRQIAAWAGMIGSALFIAIFTLESILRPGYNPLGMYVSELSLGPRGWIQITNFIIYGILFLTFTWGITAEFKIGKASKAGPILLAIIGACLLLSGPFVMDPANTLVESMSLGGTLHQLLGAIVFLLAPISCFVFWRRFRTDPNWRVLQWWTLIATVVIALAVVLLRIGSTPLIDSGGLVEWIGLIQRTALVTYVVWIFTFALVLYKRSRDPNKA
jgi:hypothetical protein